MAEIIEFNKDDSVSLYNPSFETMRNDLDINIQQVIAEMVEKGIFAGSVNLKIDFILGKVRISDHKAASGSRDSLMVQADYKVVHGVQSKFETKGTAISSRDPKEITMDNLGNLYMVSPEEASEQLSMFNSWEEYRDAMMK